MSQTEEFVPRKNLQRTLSYRSYMKWIFPLLLIVGLISVLVAFLMGTSGQSNGAILAGLSLLVAVLSFSAAFLWVRPFAQSQVHVFSDRIEIERLGQRKIILYKDVQAVEFKHIPYLTGWFVLTTAQEKIKITTVLERSDYIVESLAAFNPSLAQKGEVESYRKTAIAVDHIWASFSDRFKNRKALAYKYLVEPLLAINTVVLVAFLSEISFDFVKLGFLILGCYAFVIMLSALFWWVSSIVQILKTAQNFQKNPNYRIRDLVFEKRLEMVSQNAQRLGLLLFVIYLSFTI